MRDQLPHLTVLVHAVSSMMDTDDSDESLRAEVESLTAELKIASATRSALEALAADQQQQQAGLDFNDKSTLPLADQPTEVRVHSNHAPRIRWYRYIDLVCFSPQDGESDLALADLWNKLREIKRYRSLA